MNFLQIAYCKDQIYVVKYSQERKVRSHEKVKTAQSDLKKGKVNSNGKVT